MGRDDEPRRDGGGGEAGGVETTVHAVVAGSVPAARAEIEVREEGGRHRSTGSANAATTEVSVPVVPSDDSATPSHAAPLDSVEHKGDFSASGGEAGPITADGTAKARGA